MTYNHNRLKELRENAKLGYTDLMFALSEKKRLRISRQTLIGWERGKTSPQAKQLEKIAKFYGVPVFYFYDDGEQENA